ncbi:MAG TPA: cytochrome c [Gemmatimonadales bacterium]|nr:cytochrome c [Gemmatimonadales bacterium]
MIPRRLVLAALLGGCGERAPVLRFDPGPIPAEHAAGARVFDAACARCHGPFASGSDHGPPLVHEYYRPDHHADAAFVRAARFGVRPHHWSYGPMPPVPELTDAELARVIAYIRWLQGRAGIG